MPKAQSETVSPLFSQPKEILLEIFQHLIPEEFDSFLSLIFYATLKQPICAASIAGAKALCHRLEEDVYLLFLKRFHPAWLEKIIYDEDSYKKIFLHIETERFGVFDAFNRRITHLVMCNDVNGFVRDIKNNVLFKEIKAFSSFLHSLYEAPIPQETFYLYSLASESRSQNILNLFHQMKKKADPLFMAILCRQKDMVFELLEKHLEWLDKTDAYGNTPLHFAALSFHPEIFLHLLKLKDNSYTQNHYNLSPLHILVMHQNHEGVSLVCANKNPYPEKFNYYTLTTNWHFYAGISRDSFNKRWNGFFKCCGGYFDPLSLALLDRNEKVALQLIEIMPLCAAPYLYLAIQAELSLSFLEQLTKKNAIIDATDSEGSTALSLATHRKNYDICALLIKNGANIFAADNGLTATTPFDLAIYATITNKVVDRAFADLFITPALEYEESKGIPKILRSIPKEKEVQALHFCLEHNWIDATRILLKLGYNPNASTHLMYSLIVEYETLPPDCTEPERQQVLEKIRLILSFGGSPYLCSDTSGLPATFYIQGNHTRTELFTLFLEESNLQQISPIITYRHFVSVPLTHFYYIKSFLFPDCLHLVNLLLERSTTLSTTVQKKEIHAFFSSVLTECSEEHQSMLSGTLETLNAIPTYFELTLLHLCILKDSFSNFFHFLKNNPDIVGKSRTDTLLHFALYLGQTHWIPTLIKLGASVHNEDCNGLKVSTLAKIKKIPEDYRLWVEHTEKNVSGSSFPEKLFSFMKDTPAYREEKKFLTALQSQKKKIAVCDLEQQKQKLREFFLQQIQHFSTMSSEFRKRYNICLELLEPICETTMKQKSPMLRRGTLFGAPPFEPSTGQKSHSPNASP